MPNNLVTQQLPVQGIQIGQLDQIPNKLDPSMQVRLMGSGVNDPALQQISVPNIQMGQVGPGCTDVLSQQISISSNQAQPVYPMANDLVSEKLLVSNIQMEQQAYNLVPEQYLLPNKQLEEMKTMLNHLGSQQSSILSKRKAPMEPVPNNHVSPKSSVPNKRVAQMEHRPWLQQVSAPTKLPVQMQSISNTSGPQRSQAPSKRSTSGKTGLHQLLVQKNQTGQMQQSPKVQNESLESVRSKLRESLAGALSLVPQQQEKTSNAVKNSQSEVTSAAGEMKENSQPLGDTSTADDSVNHVSKRPKESLAQKVMDGQNTSLETSIQRNAGDSVQIAKNDVQELQSGIVLRDEDISFSDSFFVKDELLQGNGLSWVLEPDSEVVEKDTESAHKQQDQKDLHGGSGRRAVETPQTLASKIEAELFKLFGGVNKKYKEKGRSLLFNLKDRNNPELRERVMLGEIPPERLCSMTAEELASEELSQWRMAKAEELAQMVVLPDSDVDIRRLVKKTHKGEFQVEVEEQDSVSVEVAVGASSLTQMRPKSKEKESSPSSKPDRVKDNPLANPNRKKDKMHDTGEKGTSEEQNVLTIPSNEGTDLMQGLMVDDELKDAEFLPPIVSLDEFMESLNSEPPFENLSGDAENTTPISDKEDSQVGSESKSSDVVPEDSIDTTPEKPDNIDVTNTKFGADGKSIDSHVKLETTPPVGVSKAEHVWEGSLQLNISSMASVICIFKSGEKTSAKEWPASIDIKGRVRLDAFEKFLQELPMSRSRAVMAVHFVCKEGSPESERASLCEVADSYVLDGRVGFAEPAPGVELYFCPPHAKTREMLGKVLPKDQVDALNAIDNGLIGAIVWRKAQITSTKHNSKKHLSSRRHQEKDTKVNVNITSKHPLPRAGPPVYSKPQSDDNDDDDDVPPGFGPLVTRDEDDLPEFNFSSGSVTSRPQFSTRNATRGPGVAHFHPHSQATSLPVDQMRELIHRYGQPKTSAPLGNWQDKSGVGLAVQPWNDDDDDMPEWHPEDTQHPQPQPSHMRGMQQPMLRAHMVQQTPHQPMAQMGTSPAVSLHHQMNAVHGSQIAAPSWQQGTWMAPPTGSHGLPAYHPSGGQFYGSPGVGAGQQDLLWHRDAPKSRGL